MEVLPSVEGVCPSCRQHGWAPASDPTTKPDGSLESVVDIAREARVKLSLHNDVREREGLKPLDHGEAIASISRDLQLAVQKADKHFAQYVEMRLQAKQASRAEVEAAHALTIRNHVSMVRVADEELNLARRNRHSREQAAEAANAPYKHDCYECGHEWHSVEKCARCPECGSGKFTTEYKGLST